MFEADIPVNAAHTTSTLIIALSQTLHIANVHKMTQKWLYPLMWYLSNQGSAPELVAAKHY